MHAGLALGNWDADPAILVPLVITIAAYAHGVRELWSTGEKKGLRRRDVAWFATGISMIALALVSPLHEASEQSFTAHMIQHELLMAVAAPLLILGRPAVVLLWAFPRQARRAIGVVTRTTLWRRVWNALSRPFDAWLIHAVVIWGWHVPALFQAAVRSEAVHAIQHLCFIGTALLFWWTIVHPRRRDMRGIAIISLFTTAVHTAVLGALMTFARSPWYPIYEGRALNALDDQRLAGLVMWIPASFAYLIAALFVVRRWLRESDARLEVTHRSQSLIPS